MESMTKLQSQQFKPFQEEERRREGRSKDEEVQGVEDEGMDLK